MFSWQVSPYILSILYQNTKNKSKCLSSILWIFYVLDSSCCPRSSSFRYATSNLYFLPLFQLNPQLISPTSTLRARSDLTPSKISFFCSQVYVWGGSCQLIFRECTSAPDNHFLTFLIPFFTSRIRAAASTSPGLVLRFSDPKWIDRCTCWIADVIPDERTTSPRCVL